MHKRKLVKLIFTATILITNLSSIYASPQKIFTPKDLTEVGILLDPSVPQNNISWNVSFSTNPCGVVTPNQGSGTSSFNYYCAPGQNTRVYIEDNTSSTMPYFGLLQLSSAGVSYQGTTSPNGMTGYFNSSNNTLHIYHNLNNN